MNGAIPTPMIAKATHVTQSLLKKNIIGTIQHGHCKDIKFFLFFPLYFVAMICSTKYTLTTLALHKKQSFPLRISSINVTKTAGYCIVGYTVQYIPEYGFSLSRIFRYKTRIKEKIRILVYFTQ